MKSTSVLQIIAIIILNACSSIPLSNDAESDAGVKTDTDTNAYTNQLIIIDLITHKTAKRSTAETAIATALSTKNIPIKVYMYMRFNKNLDLFEDSYLYGIIEPSEMEMLYSVATTVSSSGKALTSTAEIIRKRYLRQKVFFSLGQVAATTVSSENDYFGVRVHLIEDDGLDTGQIAAAKKFSANLQAYVDSNPDEKNMFYEGMIEYMPFFSLLELIYTIGFYDDEISTPILTLQRSSNFVPTVDDVLNQGDLVETFYVIYVGNYLFMHRKVSIAIPAKWAEIKSFVSGLK